MGKAIGLLAGLVAIIALWRLGRYLRPPRDGADPAQRWLSAEDPHRTENDAPLVAPPEREGEQD